MKFDNLDYISKREKWYLTNKWYLRWYLTNLYWKAMQSRRDWLDTTINIISTTTERVTNNVLKMLLRLK